MISINTSVAGVLIAFTALGVLFYLSIVIAGTSSYACPFQTPASTTLRTSWKEIQPQIAPVVLPITSALCGLWEAILYQILHTILCLPLKLDFWYRFHCSHPPHIGEDLPTPRFVAVHNLWKKIQPGLIYITFHLPLAIKSTLHPPLPTVQYGSPVPEEITPWLAPKDLADFQRTNGSDARCVSWILKNITDPEAVEAAVRLAGTIWWFEDQANIEPPYDVISSVFEGCFGAAKEVYPGLNDRAYYSLRAILWIHTLANCRSWEFAQRFPLPIISKATLGQGGLTHLLSACPRSTDLHYNINHLLDTLYTTPCKTDYAHAQWVLNLLLHLAWVKQGDLQDMFDDRFLKTPRNLAGGYGDWEAIPLDATLNHFLVWCILLGSPVEEEALRIQNKMYVIAYLSL